MVLWVDRKPLPLSPSWSLPWTLVGLSVWSPCWGLGYWFLLTHSPTLSFSVCHHIHRSRVWTAGSNTRQPSWWLKYSSGRNWRCFPLTHWQLPFLEQPHLCSCFPGAALPSPAVCTPPSIRRHSFSSSLEPRMLMFPARHHMAPQYGLSAPCELPVPAFLTETREEGVCLTCS